MLDTYSYVCPQTWLNEAKTKIGLSSIMGFLSENNSLPYFAVLGELLSGLSFTVFLFKTFKFSLIMSWLFQEARKHIPRNTLMF